jgi:oxygen-independent coproporphyrinogen-3 oxidase
MDHTLLLEKYNVPVPRYTSYPTVPVWQDWVNDTAWRGAFVQDFAQHNSKEGISLYIHLPFCEKLCTYCGCNKKITTNHSVEATYIAALHREWDTWRSLMNSQPVIRELHLGGGTPTFFSPQNLQLLLGYILKDAIVHPQHEFSFEGHPNNTTTEHLQALYDMGFRRVSYGVQDNDPEVQRIINRIQPFVNVQRATEEARRIGFQSVNFDLIYGLPRQTTESITRTVNEVVTLRPDRVAFYSYAHVPWTSRGQRLFDENDLPTAAEKLALYRTGHQLFVQAGYYDVGMDHFALPADDLYIARQEGWLHRNFMGYTTQATQILVGLGVSAISTTPGAYGQNAKALQDYYDAIDAGTTAIGKGYLLSATDQRIGRYIREISCLGRTRFAAEDMDYIQYECVPRLQPLIEDGLVLLTGNALVVTDAGKNFIRNICSMLDHYLPRTHTPAKPLRFSKAI